MPISGPGRALNRRTVSNVLGKKPVHDCNSSARPQPSCRPTLGRDASIPFTDGPVPALEWARAKHGETRHSWRKLHIPVDPASSEIRTHELTGDDTADATMAGPLVAGSGGMIRRVFADGAYNGEPVTKAIRDARPPNSPPEIIIPPCATSIPPPDSPHGGPEREHHAAEIASKGRMNWQKRQGYGLRAIGETAMARVKRLNGGKFTARTFQSQQNEIAMQINALNRSIRAVKPNTIRIR